MRRGQGVLRVGRIGSDIKSLLVVLLSILRVSCIRLELGKVSVVVSSHFEVKDLRFNVLLGLGGGDEMVLKKFEDLLADNIKFIFDDGSVLFDQGLVLMLFCVKGSPRRPAGSNDVLVSDGEEVSLFDGELIF